MPMGLAARPALTSHCAAAKALLASAAVRLMTMLATMAPVCRIQAMRAAISTPRTVSSAPFISANP